MNAFKRFFALILSLCMVLSFVPVSAFAAETGGETAVSSEPLEGQDIFVLGSSNAQGEVRVDSTVGVARATGTTTTVSGLDGAYVAYDIDLYKDNDSQYNGAATVSIPLGDGFDADDELQGFVVNSDGSITYIDEVTRNTDLNTLTFAVSDIGVVGVALAADDEGEASEGEAVTVKRGLTYVDTLQGVLLNGSKSDDKVNASWGATDRAVGVLKDSAHNGTEVTLASCEYTMNVTNTTRTLAIVADGTTYYVRPSSSGHSSTAAQLTFTFNGDGSVYIKDDGAYYLYVNRANLNWDRNKTLDQANNTFYLYTPVTEGEVSSTEIPGYKKVTSEDGLVAGKYLIAFYDNSNNLYVMNPTTRTTSAYSQMAQVKVEQFTTVSITGTAKGDTTVVVGDVQYNVTVQVDTVEVNMEIGETKEFEIQGAAFTGATVTDPSMAGVTVNGVANVPDTYVAVASTAGFDGTKQYVLVNNRPAGINGGENEPNYAVLTDSYDGNGGLNMLHKDNRDERWIIAPTTDEGKFSIKQGDNYLAFANGQVTLSTDPYSLTLSYVTGSGTGYKPGWLIANTADNNFVSDHGGNATHVSKAYGTRDDGGNYWTIYEVVSTEDHTNVSITAHGAGENVVSVGYVDYKITVPGTVKDVPVYVGQTITLTDDTGNYKNNVYTGALDTNTANVSVDATDSYVVGIISGTAATTVNAGGTYIICLRGTTNALTNQGGSGSWGTSTLATAAHGGKATANNMWTLEASGNGYKLKNGNRYLSIGGNSASLGDTGHEFEFTYNENTGWVIKSLESNNYFNNLGSSGSIGGYAGDGTKFDIYQVTSTTTVPATTYITVTGVAEGTTSVSVGSTTYNLNVTQRVVEVELKEGQSTTIRDNSGNYTAGNVADPTKATVTASGKTVHNDYLKGMDVNDAGFLSGKQYLLVNNRGGWMVSNQGGNSNKLAVNSTVGIAASNPENYFWTITKHSDGVVTIQDVNGKYLTFGDDSSTLSDSRVDLNVFFNSNTGYWVIKNSTTYLNNRGGQPGGWIASGEDNEVGNQWKLIEVSYTDASYTDVTITGVAAGTTSVMVGYTRYDITVTNEVVDLTLKVGETKVDTIEDVAYTMDNVITPPDSTYATLDSVVGSQTGDKRLVEITSLNQIVSGKSYLIVTSFVAGNSPLKVVKAEAYDSTSLRLGNQPSINSTELWTFTENNGTYTISQNGQYLNLSGTAATVSADPQNLTLGWHTYHSDDYGADFTGCTIGVDVNGTTWYLDHYQNAGDKVSVWNAAGVGSTWKIYEIVTENVQSSTEVTFTGVKAGITTATVGHVTYNITVEKNIIEEHVTLEVDESKSYVDRSGNHVNNVTKAENFDSIATLDVAAGAESYSLGQQITAQDDLTTGSYIIVANTTSTNLTNVASGSRLALNGSTTNITKSAVWTVTKNQDGTYSIQDSDGKYLHFAGGSALVTADVSSDILTWNEAGYWYIKKADGTYLNNHNEAGTQAGGWTNPAEPDSLSALRWRIYSVSKTTSTEITITGTAVGETSVLIGDTNYIVKVTEKGVPVFNEIDVTLDTYEYVSFTDNTGDYTNAIVKGENFDSYAGVKVTVERDQIITVADSAEAGPSLENGTYIIINNRASKTLTNKTSSVAAGAGQMSGLSLYGNADNVEMEAVWTITKVSNGVYTVMDSHGEYLTIGNNSAGMNASGTNVNIAYNTRGYWTLDVNGAYLNDAGSAGNTAAGWQDNRAAGDDGSQWIIKKVDVEDVDVSTVTINGVAAGQTSVIVGNTQYNITVNHVETEVRNITLYVGTAKTDIIENYGYSNINVELMPDGSRAFIHAVETNDGDAWVYFSGVSAGKTTAQVGHVIYNITVLDLGSEGGIEDFTSIVGVQSYNDPDRNNSTVDMTNKPINSLRITAGSVFNLGVDAEITEDTTVVWTTGDHDIATVDDNGVLTAVAAGETYVTATVTKNGVEESVMALVTVVPTLLKEGDTKATLFYYIDEVNDVDPYYTIFLTSESETAPVEDHTMVMVTEHEVIFLERPASAGLGVVWTSDPFDGTALTFMAATNTAGQYYPLQTEDGSLGRGDFSVDGNNYEYYVDNTAYNNVVTTKNTWQEALIEVLEKSLLVGKDLWNDYGCDGAMSMTRGENDSGPHLVSSLSFSADKLPEVDKTVVGILGTSGLQADYRVYKEGMYAKVGEVIFFEITVTQQMPTIWEDNAKTNPALGFNAAILEDQLAGAYFYTKQLDYNENTAGPGANPSDPFYGLDGKLEEADRFTEQNILNALNAAWTDEEKEAGERVLTFNVVYPIPEDADPKLISNTAHMEIDYKSTYSKGLANLASNAEASIYLLGETLGDVVMDFGLPVTIPNLTKAQKADEFDEKLTNAAVGGCKFGSVTINKNGDTWSITYTPHTVFTTYDVVYLMGYNEAGEVVLKNYFRVYPASTVLYEESFAEYGTANGTGAEIGWSGQNDPVTGNLEYLYLNCKDPTHIHTNYGYSDKYVNENGMSNGTQAVSKLSGDTATFTFTGTGFDVYANVDENTSVMGVMVYKVNEDGTKKLAKFYQVISAGEASNSLPLVSVTDMAYGTYEVIIRHTKKMADTTAEIRVDGFRIYNPMTADDVTYPINEQNPVFTDLRDEVLSGYTDLDTSTSVSQVYSQSNKLGNVLYTTTTSSADLLEKAPKNEIWMTSSESLSFKVAEGIGWAQLGLKAPKGAVKAKITVSLGDASTASTIDITTATDMFYRLPDGLGGATVTIQVEGDGLLSVTKLKTVVGNATGVGPASVLAQMDEVDMASVLDVIFDRKPAQIQKKVTRIYGENRFETAFKVADELKSVLGVKKFDTIIVASGTGFADALSGSYLATAKNAPILLSYNETYDQMVRDYIAKNLAANGTVYILGGEAAVAASMDEALIASGVAVKRLAGANRFDTNLAILAEAGVENQEILVCTGTNFADSLSASATGKPVLLVHNESGKLTAEQAQYLAQLSGCTFTVIGGEKAVSADLENAVAAYGATKRIAGENRFQTSVAIAEAYMTNPESVVLAYAANYPDGLCGGVLAHAMNAPLVLTMTGYDMTAAEYVKQIAVKTGIVLGGEGLISNGAVVNIYSMTADQQIIVK